MQLPHSEYPPTEILDGVLVGSDGLVQFQRCIVCGERDETPRGLIPAYIDGGNGEPLEILPWVKTALQRSLALIGDTGGHGDLRLAFRARITGRTLSERPEPAMQDVTVERWAGTSEREDDAIDAAVTDIRNALLRSLGVWS